MACFSAPGSRRVELGRRGLLGIGVPPARSDPFLAFWKWRWGWRWHGASEDHGVLLERRIVLSEDRQGGEAGLVVFPQTGHEQEEEQEEDEESRDDFWSPDPWTEGRLHAGVPPWKESCHHFRTRQIAPPTIIHPTHSLKVSRQEITPTHPISKEAISLFHHHFQLLDNAAGIPPVNMLDDSLPAGTMRQCPAAPSCKVPTLEVSAMHRPFIVGPLGSDPFSTIFCDNSDRRFARWHHVPSRIASANC